MEDIRNNPIVKSLTEIYSHQIANDFIKSYEYAEKKLGSEFDKTMELLSEELIDLQLKCKPGTGILSAALLLSTPIEIEKDTEDCIISPDDLNLYIKAAAVWLVKNKGIK